MNNNEIAVDFGNAIPIHGYFLSIFQTLNFFPRKKEMQLRSTIREAGYNRMLNPFFL